MTRDKAELAMLPSALSDRSAAFAGDVPLISSPAKVATGRAEDYRGSQGFFAAAHERVAHGLHLLWVALAVLLVALIGTAFASRSAWAASSGSGSISVTMQTSSYEAVGGGSMALYLVATPDAAGSTFVYTQAFSSEGQTITQGLLDQQEEDSSYTQELASLAEQATPMSTKDIAEDGTVSFSGLSRGLYLLVQTEAADGYEKAVPFLVSLPDEDGSMTVNATPKTSPVSTTEPENPTPENPETPGTPATTTEENPSSVASILPQTGQLWWPVWLLLALGMGLLIAGVLKRRSSRA